MDAVPNNLTNNSQPHIQEASRSKHNARSIEESILGSLLCFPEYREEVFNSLDDNLFDLSRPILKVMRELWRDEGDFDGEDVKIQLSERGFKDLAERVPGLFGNITGNPLGKIKHLQKEAKNSSDAISLASVRIKEIEWLQPGRIPKGKITILAGDPDVGKTFLTLDIASRVSTGEPWPDGSANEPGNVLILSAEDDLSDTIAPRLKAAGANLNRIFALQSVTKYDPKEEKLLKTLPTLTEDFQAIEREISIHKPKLVIIDPINAYLPGIDTHRDSELRAKVFAPLKQLAEDHQIAVILVMHLNKSSSQSAKHRVSGSIAYVAASRATWLVVNDKDDSTRKLMIPVKFNIGPKPDGLAYKITGSQDGSPTIIWEKDPISINADEALSLDNSDSSEKLAAIEFLKEILSEGPVPAKDILEEKDAFSFSERTLYRAKDSLKIESKKPGGVWHWMLPESKE